MPKIHFSLVQDFLINFKIDFSYPKHTAREYSRVGDRSGPSRVIYVSRAVYKSSSRQSTSSVFRVRTRVFLISIVRRDEGRKLSRWRETCMPRYLRRTRNAITINLWLSSNTAHGENRVHQLGRIHHANMTLVVNAHSDPRVCAEFNNYACNCLSRLP